MPTSEPINILEAIHILLESHKRLVKDFNIVQDSCYVPTKCRATKEEWDALTQSLQNNTDAMIDFAATMQRYARYITTVHHEEFLAGFYDALQQTDRLDLLESYPEVEKMSVIIEAERFLGQREPASLDDDEEDDESDEPET